MSQPDPSPGKTCMWTIRPEGLLGLGAFGPWCGNKGVAVVKVEPTGSAPGYEMTLCAGHKVAWDAGLREGDGIDGSDLLNPG